MTMAWDWSHSPEAYENAYENLHRQQREWLAEALAEFEATKMDYGVDADLDLEAYERALEHARTLPNDTLADKVWEYAEALGICDDGGFTAWVCPHGCHTVSFSLS